MDGVKSALGQAEAIQEAPVRQAPLIDDVNVCVFQYQQGCVDRKGLRYVFDGTNTFDCSRRVTVTILMTRCGTLVLWKRRENEHSPQGAYKTELIV